MYYDSLSRLIGKHYRTDDNCPTNPTYAVSYSYDSGTNGKGHRTSMSDGSGSASWTYDTRGRMISESKTITGGGTFNSSWTYNSADLQTGMTYPVDGEVVNYTYNSRMLLDSVIGTSTYISSTTYDAAGQIDVRSFGNNTQTNYDYYPWNTQGGRLQYLKSGTTGNPTSLQNFTYSYDTVGNISSIADSLAGPQTQSFTYDALDRLTSGAATGGSNGLYSETYGYDATTGNLTSKGGVTLSYANPSHAHAVSSAGGNTYQYDADGNMTQRVIGGQTYNLIYDAENRLISVSGAATASFTYDGDGRQVISISAGNTIYYANDFYQKTSTGIVAKYYLASGWIAYDDFSAVEVGTSTNLVPEPASSAITYNQQLSTPRPLCILVQ
jgi:YD repeat-containing protein